MTTNARGQTVPAGSDAFDPQGSDVSLGLSVNDVVPVANATARGTALTNIGATTSRPLLVSRTDSQEIEGSWGSGFYAVSDHALSVLKSGSPGNKTMAASSTVDLIASGDTGGIPSITIDPGGRIKLDVSFQFVAATAGTAAAGTLSLLLDGAVTGTAWLVHTGLGTSADVVKQYTVTLDGWVSPATAHTVNARLTWTGGGGVALSQISYSVRG